MKMKEPKQIPHSKKKKKNHKILKGACLIAAPSRIEMYFLVWIFAALKVNITGSTAGDGGGTHC